MLYLFLIALSLAMDAFAVSASTGIAMPGFRARHAVTMGIWFGAFQFLMPLLGYLLGSSVSGRIQAIDHYVAFGLLAFIGGRMVWNSFAGGEEEACPDLSPRRLFLLAVATSIDALAVGVTLAFVPGTNILAACAVIGLVAFGLSVAGGLLGRGLGALLRRRAELVGGLVLIGIGVKILVEHLSQGI